jgi:hypothetical protein
MSKSICVPEALHGSFSKTMAEAGLALAMASEDEADVVVRVSEGRQESNDRVLESGGWISCAGAWAMAERLAIDKRSMGKLLDALDVKVRGCELGCF